MGEEELTITQQSLGFRCTLAPNSKKIVQQAQQALYGKAPKHCTQHGDRETQGNKEGTYPNPSTLAAASVRVEQPRLDAFCFDFLASSIARGFSPSIFTLTPTYSVLGTDTCTDTKVSEVIHQFASRLASLSHPQLFRSCQRDLVASRAPPTASTPRPLVLAST
ncbi:hypothetical protein BDP81DRAFT_88336 [Colletotrichum phormii]|uniref:Uncharacterized protein n=1 Tax=Colletotrichum phormii TaxID=359342 RepID=A0AAJ0EMS9_9PEZI|nr:uncharacterized protein BDP81DRAFT_88336 [Colletotrichum phormii]KAK1654768.1 hypothetical protein BDP81DRAFT_88336 [Colletotrichum phormii]